MIAAMLPLPLSPLLARACHSDRSALAVFAVQPAPPRPACTADDGVLHIVADPATMAEALPKLDLRRARLLARLGTVWQQRSRWGGVGRAGGLAGHRRGSSAAGGARADWMCCSFVGP